MQALLTVVRECQEDLAIHFKHVYVCCIYTHTFIVSYTKMTGFVYSTYYDCICIYDILSYTYINELDGVATVNKINIQSCYLLRYVFSLPNPTSPRASPQLGWLAWELLCCSSHPKDLVFEDRQTTPKE